MAELETEDEGEDTDEEEDSISATYEVISHGYSVKRLLKLTQKVHGYTQQLATHHVPPATLRRFSAELADAVCEVKSFFVYDGLSSLSDEVHDAILEAEGWFASRNETAQDYREHFLRLCVLRNNKHAKSDPQHPSISSYIHIPIGGENFETQMLEMTRAQIQQFRMFSSANYGTSCLSWLNKGFDDDEDESDKFNPNVTKTYNIVSYEEPSIILGRIGLAIRFLPKSPALYIFNEYDFDHDGSLSRSEFAAFVSDLAIAGGNIDRLEDNLKHPGRNTCLGTFLCLTAPDTDLISFVGMRHSLTMWAYKPDPSTHTDASIEERALLAVMLIFWSIAVNCAGPGLLDHSNRHYSKLEEYAIVILTDSVGQIFLFIFFMLQHNTVIRKCMFASPESSVPETLECDCSNPLEALVAFFNFTLKNSLQFIYRLIFIWLPLAITVIFSIATVSIFIYYQLWQYAATFLLTIPSARLLELFKHATVWGIKTQFGAARETLDKKKRKNKINSIESPFLFPMLVKMMENEEREIREKEKLNSSEHVAEVIKKAIAESEGSIESLEETRELNVDPSFVSTNADTNHTEQLLSLDDTIGVTTPANIETLVDIKRETHEESGNLEKSVPDVASNSLSLQEAAKVSVGKNGNENDLSTQEAMEGAASEDTGSAASSRLNNPDDPLRPSEDSQLEKVVSEDNTKLNNMVETHVIDSKPNTVRTSMKAGRRRGISIGGGGGGGGGGDKATDKVNRSSLRKGSSDAPSLLAASQYVEEDHSLSHSLQHAYHSLLEKFDLKDHSHDGEESFNPDPFGSLNAAIASAKQESMKQLIETIIDVERTIKSGGKYGPADNIKILSRKSLSKLKKMLLEAKSVLAKKKLSEKYGAFATVWPRPQRKTKKYILGDNKKEEVDESDGNGGKVNKLLKQTSGTYEAILSSESSPKHSAVLMEDDEEEEEEDDEDEDRWWQVWKRFRRRDSETVLAEREAKATEMSALSYQDLETGADGRTSRSGSSASRKKLKYGSDLSAKQGWGMVLMHRDGRWPLGIKNEISSKQCRTDEIEVEMYMVEDRRGYQHHSSSNSLSSLSTSQPTMTSSMFGQEATVVSHDPSESLALKEEEWDELVRHLTGGLVYAFPLNPLKDLVRKRGAFDKQRQSASNAKQKFKRLSQQDKSNLATSRNDLDSKIDHIIAQGGDSGHICLPDCIV